MEPTARIGSTCAAAHRPRWLETKDKNDNHDDDERDDPAHAMWCNRTADDGWARRPNGTVTTDRQFTDPNHVTLRSRSTPESTTSSDVTLRTDRHPRDGEERVRAWRRRIRSQQSLHPTRADGGVGAGG